MTRLRTALFAITTTGALALAGCAGMGGSTGAGGSGKTVRYLCGDKAPTSVDVTYQAGDPATLVARRGQKTWKMTQQRSGSGTRYQGSDSMLWEHQGVAMISLGAGSEQMRCRPAR
mgnify:CR=1 FL=1